MIKSYECPSEASEFHRDIWLFSFYLCGMNTGDIFSLKYEQIDNDFLYFRRNKTKGTQKNKSMIQLAIPEGAKKIILKWGNKDKCPSNYIFDVYKKGMTEEEKYPIKKNKNKAISQWMRRLGRKLNIDSKMGTNVARHSWATLSKHNGISVEEISENLGHTDIKTTKLYLDSFPKEHKIKSSNLISNLLDIQEK